MVSRLPYKKLTASSVHLAEHNVHAAENHNDIRDAMAEAHVFQNRDINEARRPHSIAIRIGPAVADDVWIHQRKV